LNSKQIYEVLPRLEHCWHAFIIADAYNEHTLWSHCLIEQFICNKTSNAMKYWEEFQQLILIDDQLILTMGKHLLKKNFNTISSKNFQEIISYITDSNILNRLQQI
ncbi:unnamed protein product, partial [Adineta steineri]